MNLRWAIAAFGALALAFVTVPAPWPDSHADAAGPACPANAKPANMNFTFKDLNNQEVKLSAFKGKVVLLDFWATWCGPCKIEIPWFIEFQEKYGKSGLNIIGILTEDTIARQAVRRRVENELHAPLGHRPRRRGRRLRSDVRTAGDDRDFPRR
jgi:thiol-disulfide isomerase/thioredoxin